MILRGFFFRIVDQLIGRLKQLGGFTAGLPIALALGGLALALGGLSTDVFAQQTPTDQSLGFFEDLLRNPDDIRTYLAYAHALQAEGRVEEARQIYRKVLSLNPSNPSPSPLFRHPLHPRCRPITCSGRAEPSKPTPLGGTQNSDHISILLVLPNCGKRLAANRDDLTTIEP